MAVVTKTLKSSGGDYSLISTWESTEQTDLVADGDSHVLECYTGTYDCNTQLIDWPSSAVYDVTIKAAVGEGHSGTSGSGVVFQQVGGVFTIHTKDTFLRLDGIEIDTNGYANAGIRLWRNVAVDMEASIKNCIITAEATNDYAVAFLGTWTAFTIRNTLLKSKYRCIDMRVPATGVMQNCTCINIGAGAYGVMSDSGTTLENTVVYGFSTQDMYGTPGTSSTNATSDTTGEVTGITSADFVDYAGGDYQPTSAGALAGAGTDLSAYFDDDITGTAR